MSDRIAGLDAGADDYLVKPFSVDELLARVGAHLRRSQQVDTADVLEFKVRSLNRRTRQVYRDQQ